MGKHILVIVLFIVAAIQLAGQTCCSGGVPISSNLGFQSSESGSLQLATAYEHNFLNTLYAESTVLPLNNRQRQTQSFLLRLSYNVTDRVGIEALLPYVIQRRDITQNSGDIDRESSNGIGDAVILLKYDLIKNITWNLNIGIGPKLSTGSSDQRNSIGLLLVNDLQPGSGATDIISRVALTHNLSARPSSSVYGQVVWTAKGTDPTYLGSQRYGFGSEVQVSGGISDQFITRLTTIYPAISLRYRNATRDTINDNSQENTGGKWVFLKASLGFDVMGENRISIAYERPVYTEVDGTQLSPDHIINFSFYRNFSLKNTSNKIILNP